LYLPEPQRNKPLRPAQIDHISFDVSWVSFALHDMPPNIRGKVLREMVRVIKPGGIMVDYDLPRSKRLST
jgi:ubiquinone/menaquinone biosynthesis C-methylase UbiE